MGSIVGTFATSHVLFSPTRVPEQADRVFQGMLEIGRRLQQLRPDVLVIAANDHLNNFNLALQVPLVIGVMDEYEPLGDMDIPRAPFKGNREFAEAFARYAATRGFDLAQAEEIRPDHGLALPNLLLNPGYRIPVVPLFINVGMDPPPSAARCWALGQTLRSMVENERPAGERVAVLGTGGLSHWLCVAKQGRVNEAFDRHAIELLIGGRGEELCRLDARQIIEQAGNGGLELVAWLFAAACLENARGELVYYEAMPEWLTGMGGIALQPSQQA